MVIGGEKPSTENLNNAGISNRAVLSTNRCFFLSQFKDYATETSPMNNPRMYHSSETIDEHIFVIGGVNGSLGQPVEHIEIYSLSSRVWKIGAKMITPRSCAATVVVSNKIYVLGGIDKNGKYLSTVEYYDAEKDHFFEVYKSSVEKIDDPSKIGDSNKHILPRGLAWSTVVKTGWNSFCLFGGKYKQSKLNGSDVSSSSNHMLNTKVHQFIIREDWNIVQENECVKNMTLYSHVRGLSVKYDGNILLVGGNSLKNSSEVLNIKSLSSRQTNVDLTGLDSGEVMGLIHQVNYSSMVGEVY